MPNQLLLSVPLSSLLSLAATTILDDVKAKWQCLSTLSSPDTPKYKEEYVCVHDRGKHHEGWCQENRRI